MVGRKINDSQLIGKDLEGSWCNGSDTWELPGRNEENQKKKCTAEPVFQPKFKAGTSQTQACSPSTMLNCSM